MKMKYKFLQAIALFGALSVLLQGCMSSSLYNNTANSKIEIQQDTVKYIASPVVNGKKSSSEIIILGDKYSYKLRWISTQTSDLEWVAKTLDAKFLKSKPIQFAFKKPNKDKLDSSGEATFEFEYDKQGKPLNNNEITIVKKYCQDINITAGTAKNCSMMFLVQMHEKYTPKASDSLTPVKGNYPITIKIFKPNTSARILLTPLAVAGDIVTSPVQLVAGGLFLIIGLITY